MRGERYVTSNIKRQADTYVNREDRKLGQERETQSVYKGSGGNVRGAVQER